MQPVDNDHAYLFRLGIDGDLTTLLDDVQLSNGLGFSPSLDHLYSCETMSGTIHRFAYDRGPGGLFDQSTFAEIPQEEGLPDGLTVDTEG
jgi:D-xylonolactonase